MSDAGIGGGLPALDVSAPAKTAGRSGRKDDAHKTENFGSALDQARGNDRHVTGRSSRDREDAAPQADAPAEGEATAPDAMETGRKSTPMIDIRAPLGRAGMQAAQIPAEAAAADPEGQPAIRIAGGKPALPGQAFAVKTAPAEASLPENADAATEQDAVSVKHGRFRKDTDQPRADRKRDAASGVPEKAAVSDAGNKPVEEGASLEADALTLLGSGEEAATAPEKTMTPVSAHPVAAAVSVRIDGAAMKGPDNTGRSAGVQALAATAADKADSAPETDVAGTESRVFRFSRADGKGQTMTMVVGGREQEQEGARDLRKTPVENVTVLETRRYLALSPNMTMVMNAISGDKEWTGAMQPGSALTNAANQASTGKVVNTLKIQIHPMTLGAVTATMRLSGEELSVNLQVETVAAYRQLSDDQRGLVESLRAQGFAVDQVSVTLVSPSEKPDSAGAQANGQGAASGQQSAQDGNAPPRRDERHATQQNGRDDALRGEEMAGGGTASTGGRPDHLYL